MDDLYEHRHFEIVENGGRIARAHRFIGFHQAAVRAHPFQREAPGDAATWARARGWALWKALIIMAAGMSHITTENPADEVAAAVIADHRALN